MTVSQSCGALPELLAPAGGPAAFKAALAAGANAIYCGLDNSLNARRGAENFDEKSFEAACAEAHVAGVRVYVTMNVVVREEELARAVAEVAKLLRLGADAFIIQDWGLFEAVIEELPQVEVHVSTQANVHDVRGTLWCREHGAARVTLSRELTLPEIAACSATGVETEVFAHGAICICYSGLCHMSAMRGDRSANRGLCAQPCRLPHELVDERGESLSREGWERALCPKDNCTIDDVAALAAAGAGSLKIEGRMKAPEYVLSVVSSYREALDALGAVRAGCRAAAGVCAGAEAGTGTEPTPFEAQDAKTRLARAFNRGFTSGYLRGESGASLMSYERSNNRGELVGEVVQANGSQAWVRCTKALNEGDLLELRPTDAPETFLTAPVLAAVPAGTVTTVPIKRFMPQGTPARVIRNAAALDEARLVARAAHVVEVPVAVAITLKKGEPARVTLTTLDGVEGVGVGAPVEAARTKELTQEDVVEHVCRLGSTPFVPVVVTCELDPGCGMSFGALHAVRAQAAEALVEALSAPQPGVSYAGCDTAQRWVREVARLREAYAASSTRLSAMPEKNEKAARAGEGVRELPLHAAVSALAGSRAQKSQVQEVALAAELCVRVISVEQAQAAVAEGAERLYVPGDVVLLAGAAALEPAGGAAAAQKCGEQAAFERLARAGYAAFTQVAGAVPVVVELDDVCREADVPRQDALMAVAACVAAGNVSEVALLEGQGQPFEVTEAIPVHNSRAALAFEAAGATALWLDQELTLEQIAQIAAGSGAALGIALWGHTRTMLTEHCVLTVAGACGQACESCGLRHRKLFLKNIDNKLLPVTTDIHGRSHIYWADPTDLVPDLEKLLLAGVGRVRIDGTLATPEALAGEVKRARRALERLRHGGAGKRPGRERGAHAGHLTGGVA